MNLRRLALSAAVVAVALLAVVSATASAHQSGCHRWHTCPSDSGSYVCGDLGYPCEGGAAATPPPAVVIPVDKNCPDFASHAEAQAYFTSKGGPGLDPDGLDVDHDGVACEVLPGAPPQPPCSNEQDDDADGLPDGVDPECVRNPAAVSEAIGACTDGADNDADFLVDQLDPSCTMPQAASESGGDDPACKRARLALYASQKKVRALRSAGYSRARSSKAKRKWRTASRQMRTAGNKASGACVEA